VQNYCLVLPQSEREYKISAFFLKKQILIAKNGKKLAFFRVGDWKGVAALSERTNVTKEVERR